MKRLLCILPFALAACDQTGDAGDSAVAWDQAVLFSHGEDLEPVETPWAWGLRAKTLRADPDTGAALDVTAPANWRALQPLSFDRDLEIIMLEGALRFQRETLDNLDFLHIPAGSAVPPPKSGRDGARFLMIFESGLPRPLPLVELPEEIGTDWRIVGDKSLDWEEITDPAEMAQVAPASRKIYRRAENGAQTSLLRISAQAQGSWVAHDGPQEAYLINGSLKVSECLPKGLRSETYGPGGYLYRPAGLPHQLPGNGTAEDTLLLVRTPGQLTISLTEACPEAIGKAPEPLLDLLEPEDE